MSYIGQARCRVVDVGIPKIGIIRPLSSATWEPKSRKSVQRYYFFLKWQNVFSFFIKKSMKYIRLGVEWRMKKGEKKKRFGSFEKK